MRIHLLTLALCHSTVIAQDFSWPADCGGEWGLSTIGFDEYEYQSRRAATETFNPDGLMQKRLVVEWGQARMGYVGDAESDEADKPSRHIWKDDNSLRPDRMLSIRGRLLIASEDGKSRQPIDWVQGIRVVVSRVHDQKPDWNTRHDRHDAVWENFVISEKGEFLVTISPGAIRREVDKALHFQIALSLAEMKSTRISWRNTVGVLPQSVMMLKIPGPPAIPKTMQIINGAPAYEQNDFNPAKLVRAVNHLIPMGKEQAIRKLREYLKVASNSGTSERIEENIDASDKTCVYLIIRLLFESADPAKELPEIHTLPFLPLPHDHDKPLWPLHPIYLQDDLPFFLVYGGSMVGPTDRPENHVDWAEDHGTIRTKPLRPVDNPMLAAERLVALPQSERLYRDESEGANFHDLLYQQAWNIIEDADPKVHQPNPIPPANSINATDWNFRLKAAARLKIHWNAARNQYEVP